MNEGAEVVLSRECLLVMLATGDPEGWHLAGGGEGKID